MKLIAGCLLLGSLTFAQNAPTAFQNVDGCGQTPQVPNGYIEDGPSDFGTRRTVRCNPGAIREGPWVASYRSSSSTPVPFVKAPGRLFAKKMEFGHGQEVAELVK